MIHSNGIIQYIRFEKIYSTSDLWNIAIYIPKEKNVKDVIDRKPIYQK